MAAFLRKRPHYFHHFAQLCLLPFLLAIAFGAANAPAQGQQDCQLRGHVVLRAPWSSFSEWHLIVAEGRVLQSWRDNSAGTSFDAAMVSILGSNGVILSAFEDGGDAILGYVVKITDVCRLRATVPISALAYETFYSRTSDRSQDGISPVIPAIAILSQ